MASFKGVSRLSSRLQPLGIKLNKKTSISSLLSPVKPISESSTPISRSLRSLSTMLPLHSAIASARLTSSLSIESKSWGLVPQGISMPL